MKMLSKNTKIFALILLIGAILAAGICIVSISAYGKVYFFDGFAITRLLWIIVICLGLVGSVGTLIFAFKDLNRMANGQPYPTDQPVGPGTVNEQMSQRAQFDFNRLLEQYRAAGTEVTDVTAAALFAQAVELQLLKAPASAVFCPLGQMTVSPMNGAYVVKGFVDAQNSYGAMMRTPFTLTVMKTPYGWKSVDSFINSGAQIAAGVAGKMIIYTVIGTVLALVFGLISYLVISSVIR